MTEIINIVIFSSLTRLDFSKLLWNINHLIWWVIKLLMKKILNFDENLYIILSSVPTPTDIHVYKWHKCQCYQILESLDTIVFRLKTPSPKVISRKKKLMDGRNIVIESKLQFIIITNFPLENHQFEIGEEILKVS